MKFKKKLKDSLPTQCMSAFNSTKRLIFQRNNKYQVMIETCSLCNAQCSFCSNPNLKRKKGIMEKE